MSNAEYDFDSQTSSVTQLDRDWLDALGLLRPAVMQVGHLIWPHISICKINLHSLTFTLEYDKRSERYAHIRVSEEFPALPRVERLELLLYCACASHLWIREAEQVVAYSPSLAMVRLCKRVGCLDQGEQRISDRWRKLDFITHWQTLPVVLGFEDRPRCKICNSPVATGAEWERYDKVGESTVSVPNLHNECARYAHRILVPQIKAARAAVEASSLHGGTDA